MCVCVCVCLGVCWVVGDALTAAADMTCVTNIFFLYYLLCLKCIMYDMPLSCCMHSYIFLYATINDMRNLLHKCNIEGCCEKGIMLRYTHPFLFNSQHVTSSKGIP